MKRHIWPRNISIEDDRRMRLKNAIIKRDIVIPSEHGEIVIPAIRKDFDLVDVGCVPRRLKSVAIDPKELLISGTQIILPEEVHDHVELRGRDKRVA